MVTLLKTTAVTNSDITLSWDFKAVDHNDIVNWRVYHQQMGKQPITLSELLGRSERSYTITGLESDQDYRVCLLAIHNSTTHSECIDTSTSTWHMPVSIGSTVGALVALTVIITIVLLAKCRGKQKQRSRRNSSKCYFSTSHFSSSMDPNLEISDLNPVSEVDDSSATAPNESKFSYYYSDGKHGYHSVPPCDKSIQEKSPEHWEGPSKCEDEADNSLAINSETQCDLNCNKPSVNTIKPGEDTNTNKKVKRDKPRPGHSKQTSTATFSMHCDVDSIGRDLSNHHKSVLASNKINTSVAQHHVAKKQEHAHENRQTGSCVDNHQKICSAVDHKKRCVENKADGQAEPAIADQSISIKFTGENVTVATSIAEMNSPGNDSSIITTQSADAKCVGNQSGVNRKGVNVSCRAGNLKESQLLDMLPESAV